MRRTRSAPGDLGQAPGTKLRVVLVSEDPVLARACEAVLANFSGYEWEFRQAEETLAGEADVYVWDFEYCQSSFQESALDKRAIHLALASAAQVQTLRNVRSAVVTTVVKPFSSNYFSAVLETVIRAFADEGGPVAWTSGLDRSQRQHLLQRLLHLNMRLQEHHIEQMNFLARALHDFRAPLTAISGYSSLLRGESLGPLNLEQIDILERMEHSISRLSRMATDTFQLSLRNRASDVVHFRRGCIHTCIQDALEEMAGIANLKGLTVTDKIIPPETAVRFDSDQITRVLVNVLDNACRFTPVGGLIELEAYPCVCEGLPRREQEEDRGVRSTNGGSVQPNAYRIDVRDSGPAIPPDRTQDIFEPYTSYEGGRDRSGCGLGLAVSRMIVEAHRGRILAESGEHGTTISVILPLFPDGTQPDAGLSD